MGKVDSLASTSVPFTLTTAQVPNLALTHKKWITVHEQNYSIFLSRSYCHSPFSLVSVFYLIFNNKNTGVANLKAIEFVFPIKEIRQIQ
jgi:hypothetical protein